MSPIVFLAVIVARKPSRNAVETALAAHTIRTAPVVVVGLRSVSRSAAPIVASAPRTQLSVPAARFHASLRGAGVVRAESSDVSVRTANFSG